MEGDKESMEVTYLNPQGLFTRCLIWVSDLVELIIYSTK